mgnify:CR=1 FL=1
MRATVVWLLPLLLVASCGHSQLRATQPDVKLYVDGDLVGKGTGEIKRMGFPKSVVVEARRGSAVLARQEISRRFTFSTAILGFVTLYTGFFWAWQYPDVVEIFVPESAGTPGEAVSPWDRGPSLSPWDQPYGGRYAPASSAKEGEVSDHTDPPPSAVPANPQEEVQPEDVDTQPPTSWDEPPQ